MGSNSPDNSDSENSDTQVNSPNTEGSSSSIMDFLISNWKIILLAILIIGYMRQRNEGNVPTQTNVSIGNFAQKP